MMHDALRVDLARSLCHVHGNARVLDAVTCGDGDGHGCPYALHCAGAPCRLAGYVRWLEARYVVRLDAAAERDDVRAIGHAAGVLAALGKEQLLVQVRGVLRPCGTHCAAWQRHASWGQRQGTCMQHPLPPPLPPNRTEVW